MPRLCVVPWLVLGVLLSGCKSSPQAGTASAPPQAEAVGKYYVAESTAASGDATDGWLARHPHVQDALTTATIVLVVAAGVALGILWLAAPRVGTAS